MSAPAIGEAAQHEANEIVRRRLVVRGVVQGIGFRPYVYRLAARKALAGWVKNTSSGVLIEVEGPARRIDEFVTALPLEGPPLMRIDVLHNELRPPLGGKLFRILESEATASVFALVPADVCVCNACLAETQDPRNRRFEYPFTNCTNCGPRYSIIEDVPYDRPKTTMSDFAMCADCQREYDSPTDRRFHAQPNACPVCGPHLELVSSERTLVNQCDQTAGEIVAEVARLLRAGKIVAWKGLGGFQLACDARNPIVVRELRRRKQRNEKPFALMVRNVGAVDRLCLTNHVEREVLQGVERPIVLLTRRAEARLADDVFCGTPTAGMMLPCTPMHELLMRKLYEQEGVDVPLVMTSGNLSEEPIVIENSQATRILADVADVFVLHNRRIHTRVDDSVLHIVEGAPALLRRARGYTPYPLWLGRGDAEVLACGAQQKSTLCLTKHGNALLSQHLGNLENYETLMFYQQTLARMERLFNIRPKVIAHDLHPGYLSTQLALRLAAERQIGVQHHHAHIAACMAEHGLEGRVIGVAWDGTGLGTDGTIWGGEFLIADLTGFTREAHLRPMLLAGGDVAVREPWRVARACLLDSFDNAELTGLTWRPPATDASLRTLDTMLRKRIQTASTTSCGRLFDAVASLMGMRHSVSFEGQAAMALEAVAADDVDEAYDLTVSPFEGGPAQMDTRPMIRELLQDIDRGVPIAVVSARFHNTLVACVIEVCSRIRQACGLNCVCLGGGCFQNVRLLRGCVRGLRAAGFEVFFPQRVPVNDGGIAFGQAAIACELLRQGR